MIGNAKTQVTFCTRFLRQLPLLSQLSLCSIPHFPLQTAAIFPWRRFNQSGDDMKDKLKSELMTISMLGESGRRPGTVSFDFVSLVAH